MNRSSILIALIITTFFFTCCSDSSGPDDQKTDAKSSYSSDNKLTLKDVDFINLKTHFENDMLIAQLQFLNIDTDELIIWTDNNVPCSYTIYRTDSLASSEKYEEIKGGEKVLSRSFQNIYIDIVDQLEGETWYLIEFTVDTGYRNLKASNTFALPG